MDQNNPPKNADEAKTAESSTVEPATKAPPSNVQTNQESAKEGEEVTQAGPLPVAPPPPPPPATTTTSGASLVEEAPVIDTASAKSVLENITTPLVVELGRVTLDIMALAQLKPGFVIELSKAPSQPVDLVVAGKLIGKGELVEVEGELGVRIISLVK